MPSPAPRADHALRPGARIARGCIEQVLLAPDEETTVTVDVTSPDTFVGRQAINVNAFAGDWMAGGVTLFVEGQ
jgi:hypothetical protein